MEKKIDEKNNAQDQYMEALHKRIFQTENILENRPYISKTFPDQPLTDNFVYFAFNPSNILTKVGRSEKPEKRLWVFKSVEPDMELVKIINVKTLGQAIALEQFLHQFFSKKRRDRELFALNEFDMSIVDLLKTAVEMGN